MGADVTLASGQGYRTVGHSGLHFLGRKNPNGVSEHSPAVAL